MTRASDSHADADLMAIGKRCAFQGCGQLDFLPFQCSACKKTFCLEHRTHHGCTAQQGEQNSVIVCPLCAKAVIVGAAEDPDLVFDRHSRTDCDPSNYERVHKKKRCPAPGCREKLTTINSYVCKDCGATVCLKHRLGPDHQCPGRQTAAAASAQSRFSLPPAFKKFFSSSSAGTAGNGSAAGSAAGRPVAAAAPRPNKPQQARPAAGGAAAAAAAQARQLEQYRQAQRQRAAPAADQAAAAAAGSAEVVDLTGLSPARLASAGAAPPPSSAAGAEVCPQCGARFGSVQDLITHAESAHMDGWASGHLLAGSNAGGAYQQQQQRGAAGASGGLERCPHCGQAFTDPVQLVAHVERQHAAQLGSKETCVLC